jgi:hypothetical protein
MHAITPCPPSPQVFCGEDAVRLSNAHAPYDIWALDPWEVIGMALPGKVRRSCWVWEGS